jgi:quinol monooxygenase YgiN
MTTVLASFRIADWEHWRAGYANAVAATPDLRSYRIWRGQDDPNYVVIAETFDSREIAEAAFTSEETRRMMEADGIDLASLRIEYLDEVD